jgi:hypothetical protein
MFVIIDNFCTNVSEFVACDTAEMKITIGFELIYEMECMYFPG